MGRLACEYAGAETVCATKPFAEGALMDNQPKGTSQEDREKARAIYQGILEHAQANPIDPEEIKRTFLQLSEASARLDVLERNKTTEFAALCDAHGKVVQPLKDSIAKSMDLLVLATLLVRNQDFLKRLEEFDGPAQDLSSRGRARLSETLQTWKTDTQSANAMIQCVLHSQKSGVFPSVPAPASNNPPFQPAPPPPPVAEGVLTPQALLGIWDATLSNGAQYELAFDNATFSNCRVDGTIAFWGSWTLNAPPGQQPVLCLARKGSYPAAYYGPLGSQPIPYPPNEVWGITSFTPDRISFGADTMLRRPSIQLPFVTARIAQVQANFSRAELQNQNNAAYAIAQNKAIGSVQSAMWDYINSGAGRLKR
jgi:hypothetical protein